MVYVSVASSPTTSMPSTKLRMSAFRSGFVPSCKKSRKSVVYQFPTLAWLQQYRDDHPFFPLVISQGVWDVAAYVPDGPHKRDLDAIASIRPIVLFDNSGHSVWVNSAMLRALGIDRDTPDLSENLSYIVRDDAGEPTGWLKELP